MKTRSTSRSTSLRFWCARGTAIASLGLLALGVIGCGDKAKVEDPNSKVAERVLGVPELEADPLLLFPGLSVSLSNTDARALFANPTLGKDLLATLSVLLPLGDESGFVASRDLERVYAASYTLANVNIVGALVGKFDASRIAAAAFAKVNTKYGPLLETTVSGRKVYTVGAVGFSVVSPRLVIVGDEMGLRRTLERLTTGIRARALEPWAVETVATKGMDVAVAIDLTRNPVERVNVGFTTMDVTKGLRMARVFMKSGAGKEQLAGSLTFATADDATRSEKQMRQLQELLARFAITGVVPGIEKYQANIVGTNIQFTFEVDEPKLLPILRSVPQYLRP